MSQAVPAATLLLALDTATRASIVALGRPQPVAISRAEVGHRHGSHLLEQVEEALADAKATIDGIGAIIVGTGPGSFTGLRVGLATAKTLAHVRALPLVGVATVEALRLAVGRGPGTGDAPAVVLPAGARDHYLAREGQEAILVAPGDLRAALGPGPAIAVDLGADLLGAEAAQRGEEALEALPAALLEIGAQRLAAGRLDDPVTLVPEYVALPRGVQQGPEELGWSPDLR
jgi:tRNA threonylcarbamoyl adenosine modification protein YeaZ